MLKRLSKEKMYAAILPIMILGFMALNSKAYEATNDGVTMVYNLTKSGSWNAYTYCMEDASSYIGMFLYSKTNCGGSVLWSDSKTVHTRTPVPGFSATWTYAALSKSNNSAKSAKSSHYLKVSGTNIPCVGTRYLSL
ncbi:MAG: hypothetical protein Q4D54_05205 [Eubacteriales bacterium]|nr:hypothetical protein [Eubacteriales bacterium]